MNEFDMRRIIDELRTHGFLRSGEWQENALWKIKREKYI